MVCNSRMVHETSIKIFVKKLRFSLSKTADKYDELQVERNSGHLLPGRKVNRNTAGRSMKDVVQVPISQTDEHTIVLKS